jgi:hypothetical protein
MIFPEAVPTQTADHTGLPTPSELHIRSKFSAAEDVHLRSLVETFGRNDWYAISLRMPGRTPRQCKERWRNYLSPALNTAAWTAEEDRLLLEKYRDHGTKWALIANFFPNRTDGMVKNRFNRLQRRQAKISEVNLRYDTSALLYLLGLTARTRARKPVAAVPVQEPQLVEPPSAPEFDFDPWNDPIEGELFEF